MRKKACSFFPIAAALAVSSLCGSCKGGRLSLAAVEPHVVYDFSTGEAGDQYLVVFVRTEGGGDVDAVSLACQADSLCWHGMSVSKVSEDCFFSVFSIDLTISFRVTL